MKRLLYLGGAAVFITSFTVVGGTTYAAHQAAQAHKPMMNVRICSSTPVGIPADFHLAKGIFNGADLATANWKAKFKKINVNIRPVLKLDYARADASGTDPAKERVNALKCAGQSDTYGYDGTLNSSIAKISEPILNKRAMLMISPSNSAIELTSPTQRKTYEPLTASGKLKFPSYYRVVTTDALQGPAAALLLHQVLKAKSYYLVDDGQDYGVGLARSMDAFNVSQHFGMSKLGSGRVDTSSSASISSTSAAIADQVASKKADVMYCGCNLENAYLLARDARRRGFRGAIIGGDAIFDSSWIKEVGQGNTPNDYATFIGLNPAFAAKGFRTAYDKMFPGFGLGPYDAQSYDAANIIYKSIYEAVKAGKLRKGSMFQKRAAILPFARHIVWFGANGKTTFDKNGDTQNRVLSYFKVKGNDWAFLRTAPKLPSFLKPTT